MWIWKICFFFTYTLFLTICNHEVIAWNMFVFQTVHIPAHMGKISFASQANPWNFRKNEPINHIQMTLRANYNVVDDMNELCNPTSFLFSTFRHEKEFNEVHNLWINIYDKLHGLIILKKNEYLSNFTIISGERTSALKMYLWIQKFCDFCLQFEGGGLKKVTLSFETHKPCLVDINWILSICLHYFPKYSRLKTNAEDFYFVVRFFSKYISTNWINWSKWSDSCLTNWLKLNIKFPDQA